MASCDIKPFLPRKGVEGEEVCDKYGSRWKYDPESNGWISTGSVSEAPLVTEQADGLLTSDVFDNLRKLQTYVDGKTLEDLRTLKLLPGRDAYWYYFKSSDKLFRFRQEGEDQLRIEVDKGRFFQILMKEVCPGFKGPKGIEGDKGLSGKPSAPEICYSPSTIDDNRLDFAIFTPTPLEELHKQGRLYLPGCQENAPDASCIPDISVRLFKTTFTLEGTVLKSDQLNDLAIFYSNNDPRNEILPKFQATRDLLRQRSLGIATKEGLCTIPLSDISVFPEGSIIASAPSVTITINPYDPSKVKVTPASGFSRHDHGTSTPGFDIDVPRTTAAISFDPDTNIVCGSIFLKSTNWSDLDAKWPDITYWCIKSSQQGPNGLEGDPGECRVKVVECFIDDTNIRATCPIINARVDCEREIIYTLCSDLMAEICVDKINLLPESETLADSGALKSVFAAAEMTLEECKRINRYKVQLESDELPELNLLHWDPQPGCHTKRHYDRHKFTWIPDTDIPACDSTAMWFGPDSDRSGKYPWPIVIPPEPPEDECCQDEFFFCPNVQNAPMADCDKLPSFEKESASLSAEVAPSAILDPSSLSPPSPSSAAALRAGHGVNFSGDVQESPQLQIGTRKWQVRT